MSDATNPTGWTKVTNVWDRKVYQHASGMVRVTRHARSRSVTHRDGRFAVGRSTVTTRWSTVDVQVAALASLGINLPSCATVRDGWVRVEDCNHRILGANLAEAKRIAEAIQDGRHGLHVRTWNGGACLRLGSQ